MDPYLHILTSAILMDSSLEFRWCCVQGRRGGCKLRSEAGRSSGGRNRHRLEHCAECNREWAPYRVTLDQGELAFGEDDGGVDSGEEEANGLIEHGQKPRPPSGCNFPEEEYGFYDDCISGGVWIIKTKVSNQMISIRMETKIG